MDTLSAYAMGQLARLNNSSMRMFDWIKAAQLIKERNAKSASAGLMEDWSYTGGKILENGKPVKADDTYVYLSSNWATPAITFDDCESFIQCWTYGDDPGYWPSDAKKILKE